LGWGEKGFKKGGRRKRKSDGVRGLPVPTIPGEHAGIGAKIEPREFAILDAQAENDAGTDDLHRGDEAIIDDLRVLALFPHEAEREEEAFVTTVITEEEVCGCGPYLRIDDDRIACEEVSPLIARDEMIGEFHGGGLGDGNRKRVAIRIFGVGRKGV
jgi:hypothetical protein